eukprot:3812149-Amphidinium_carterae.1
MFGSKFGVLESWIENVLFAASLSSQPKASSMHKGISHPSSRGCNTNDMELQWLSLQHLNKILCYLRCSVIIGGP